MCLIVTAIHAHPEYPLIIAANRDEFYHRPTAPLGFWEDHPEVLAGRDLQGEGTWLGVSKLGRIAAVTNYRNPSIDRPNALSRGLLVSHFLMGSQSPQKYIDRISCAGDLYNGFNLIVGDVHGLWWHSNVSADSLELKPGIHGICNHLLDTPWPKLEKAKSGFLGVIKENSEIDPESIFQLLTDMEVPPDNRLPDTGVGLDREKMLASIFVKSDIYGTRSSSIILYHKSGLLTFMEKTFLTPSPTPTTESTRQFEINLKSVLNKNFTI
jgi:uncharacterized protein with NRDE domain